MNPRSAWNQQVARLEQAMKDRAEVPPYEYVVDQIVRSSLTSPGGVSPQEIGETLYNLYAKYGPAPSKKFYGTMAAETGEVLGAYTDSPGPTQAEINAVREQAVPLFNQFIDKLKEKYGEAKAAVKKSYDDALTALTEDYWSSATQNDKNFGQGLRSATTAYNARGLADSSYKDQAISDQRSTFYDNLTGLDKARTRGQDDLNYQLSRSESELDRGYADERSNAYNALQNISNPNRPTFSDFGQLQQYYGSLEGNKPAVSTVGAKKLSSSIDFKPYYDAITKGQTQQRPTMVGNMSREDLNKWLYPQGR